MNPHELTIAVCDLDDTLLRRDHTLSPRTVAAITRWIKSGRRFVIATGRPPRSIGEHLPDVLQAAPWICYNGAEIRQTGKVLYRQFIPAHAAHPLIDRILEACPDAVVGVELDDVLWLNRERPQPATFGRHNQVVDLRSLAGRDAPKVIVFADALEEVAAACEPLPAGVRLMLSGRYPFLQLMSDGADKAHALSHLLHGWGATRESVIAFGDDINDIDMLRHARVGVAVANAWPPVLRVADFVTATVEADGVAMVLEALLEGRKP